MRFPSIDQKWTALATVAAGGALAALAGSDAVDPRVAALCAAAVAILGAFGITASPNRKQEQKAADEAVAAHIADQTAAQKPAVEAPTTADLKKPPHTPWPKP